MASERRMMRCVHPVLSPVINAKLAMYFDELCEEHLVQPTFVTEYPVEVSH